MKHFEKIIPQNICRWEVCFSSFPDAPSKYCFFDIETTGLSPDVSSVYLIGAAYFCDGQMSLHQWFADDYESEENILTEFSHFLHGFSTVVHFNGSRFDIPYLEKKYKAYNLSSPFSSLASIDTYKEAKKCKQLFSLENGKLTTVEKMFGFKRMDTYTGKDCISLYVDFMQKKIFRDEGYIKNEEALCLHNADDIAGTIMSCLLFSYTMPAPDAITIDRDKDAVICTIALPHPLNIQREKTVNEFSLTLKNEKIILSLPVENGAMYHYFPDYKNYYYLPKEDMAIHKSVAAYVDASHRQKATKETCYIKKQGAFVKLPAAFLPDSFELFECSLKDKTHYVWLDKDFSRLQSLGKELYEACMRQYFF